MWRCDKYAFSNNSILLETKQVCLREFSFNTKVHKVNEIISLIILSHFDLQYI